LGRAIAIMLGMCAALLLIGQCVGSEEYQSPSTVTFTFEGQIPGADRAVRRARNASERIPVASDPRADHRLLNWTRMSNGNVEAVTRRDGPSGTRFARREIDCGARTFRTLGEGDTLGEALADVPSPGFMGPLAGQPGSAQAADFICRKAGRQGPYSIPEAVVTGWRQRTARRFAVGRRSRLGASSALDGYPDPPFGPLLPSRLLRPIPATSGIEYGP